MRRAALSASQSELSFSLAFLPRRHEGGPPLPHACDRHPPSIPPNTPRCTAWKPQTQALLNMSFKKKNERKIRVKIAPCTFSHSFAQKAPTEIQFKS